MNRDQIKQEIEKLIKKYADFEKTRSRKGMDSVSEANVRADFIDPLFEILGWDILNPDEYDREHFIRGTGFADVALKQEGMPVVFTEAKRFGDPDEYLAAVGAAEQVEREIAETDQEIDARVYELYGLGAVEIEIVEKHVNRTSI